MPRDTPTPSLPQALGESEAFLRVQEQISRAAKTERPVILIGERGTGKELAASRLHLLSTRWNQPYATLNCAALAPTLLESELFGYEAGAFTGALRTRKGRFESAQGGTLFLDEIGNLPLTVQEKILRTVEYGQMERVGSAITLHVDVRLIAATHENLPALAECGKFRRDLLDRLAFEVITLPPLRARKDDIMLLARHYAWRMASELGREAPPRFSSRAEAELLDYAWPGNVRELKNVVERMVYRSDGAEIDGIVFDPFISEYAVEGASPRTEGTSGKKGTKEPENSAADPSLGSVGSLASLKSLPPSDGQLPLTEAIDALERRRVTQALEACRFNQRRAAESLGLTYDQFRRIYRKHRAELESSMRVRKA